jgi:ribosomal protein L10
MSSTRKGLVLITLLLAAALVLPGCVTISDGGGISVGTTDTYDATFPVTADAHLDVQNRNGSISIVAANGDSIIIHAVKSTNYGKSEFDKVRIDVTQGDPFTIATTVLREPARVSVSYELQVPRSMLVRKAVTTNGSVQATGVQGTMELHTSNVTAENIGGAVLAATTNGNVTIRKATTVSGATTTNGTVECEVAALGGSSVDVHTTNGNATVWVSPTLPATLEASTTNGNLTTESISLNNATASRHQIRGDLGTPKGVLSVRTTNGNVTIHKLNP